MGIREELATSSKPSCHCKSSLYVFVQLKPGITCVMEVPCGIFAESVQTVTYSGLFKRCALGIMIQCSGMLHVVVCYREIFCFHLQDRKHILLKFLQF